MLKIDGGIGGDSGDRHVADTWQKWTFTRKDGTSFTRSSATVGVNVQFDILDLNLIRSLKVELPIRLQTRLKGPGECTIGGLVPSPCSELVIVQPVAAVTIDGTQVASIAPPAPGQSSWWDPWTFTPDDPVGTIINYDVWFLLTGDMQSSARYTIDLRRHIASLGRNSFQMSIAISEIWDAYKSGLHITRTDHQEVSVFFSAGLSIDLSQFSGTLTLPAPTQTLTRCDGNLCVVIVGTVYTTTTKGVTAIVSVTHTTVTLRTEVTQPFGGLTLGCSLLPENARWLCDSTLGIPNWILVGVAAVLLLVVVFWPRPKVRVETA